MVTCSFSLHDIIRSNDTLSVIRTNRIHAAADTGNICAPLIVYNDESITQ